MSKAGTAGIMFQHLVHRGGARFQIRPPHWRAPGNIATCMF